ncbi:MAG: FlgD immunoglobulin-like domain containing protein [Rhodothermales bacterium]
MYSPQYFRARVANIVLAILFPVVIVSPASAQLTLESMLPAHGSENVATSQPLVLNFSQAIDTTALFGGEEGFFIGAQVSPATGQPLGYSLNASRTQLTVNVLLSDDTQYTVILLGAKAESGDFLDHPYAWTFSTGTLPAGSVSGTVSFPGSTPQNAVVALFAPDFFTGSGDGGDDDGPQFLGAAVVTGEDGSYQIDYAPDGAFQPAAFQDVDHDGEPNASVAGEGLGFYDSNGDHVPDEIAVSGGQQVTGVDVEIRSGGATARATYDDVLALAQSVRADAILSGIQGGDLTPDGQGANWLYIFYSAASEDTLGVALNFGYLFPIDDVSLGGVGGDSDPAMSLPDDWIDSSVALEKAEGAGGFDFRMGNPDVFIEVGLFNIVVPVSKQQRAETLQGGEAGKYGSVADLQPAWVVSYNDRTNFASLQIIVDALTGEVVPTATEGSELPESSMLLERYPNPSRGPVSVLYELETPGDVELTISNALGQTVRRLVDGLIPAGAQSTYWDGTDAAGMLVAPGNYWLRLKTDRGVFTRSMTVVR